VGSFNCGPCPGGYTGTGSSGCQDIGTTLCLSVYFRW
jgi:hypothetical protein